MDGLINQRVHCDKLPITSMPDKNGRMPFIAIPCALGVFFIINSATIHHQGLALCILLNFRHVIYWHMAAYEAWIAAVL